MLIPLAGLGDDSTDSTSFSWPFAGGSVLTAAVLGIGLIIATKTVLAPKRKPKKKWASGAWRSEDYEERSPDYGVRPSRRRRS